MTNILSSFKSSTRVLIASGVLALAMFILAIPSVSHAEILTRQLEFGMSGTDVSALQTYLATDATIYPQGLVTGYFGPLTKSAVMNFQSRNGISMVGRVGPITLAALNQKMNGDSQAPVINSLNIVTTNNAATFNWNTNENAGAIIYYSTYPLSMTEATISTGVTIGGSSLLVDASPRAVHTGVITGLTANTTYYYVVYVRDAAGNENISWPATFQTTN